MNLTVISCCLDMGMCISSSGNTTFAFCIYLYCIPKVILMENSKLEHLILVLRFFSPVFCCNTIDAREFVVLIFANDNGFVVSLFGHLNQPF